MSGKRRKGGQKKKQEKHKKTPRKFAYLRISCYLCTRKTETGTMPNVKFHSTLHDKPFLFVRKSTRKTETDTLTTVSCDAIGRLAQLVQSVCLTSRGSGVRIPQRPPGVFPVISSEVAGIFFLLFTLSRILCQAVQDASSANTKRQPSMSVRHQWLASFYLYETAGAMSDRGASQQRDAYVTPCGMNQGRRALSSSRTNSDAQPLRRRSGYIHALTSQRVPALSTRRR